MTPKEYLNQIYKLTNAIYFKEEETERLRAELDIKGISYDGDKVTSSPQDRTPELVAKILDLEAKNNNRRSKCIAVREKIIRQIEEMDDPIDSLLLYYRYVNFMPLEAIADKMGYTHGWIRQRHGVALIRFEKKYAPLIKNEQ